MTTAEQEQIDALIQQEVARGIARGTQSLQRSLQRDDLLSEAWLAVLELLEHQSTPAPAQVRLRIRGAIADAFRQEMRGQGQRMIRGVLRSIRWPVYWPRIEELVDNPRRRPRPSYWRSGMKPKPKDVQCVGR